MQKNEFDPLLLLLKLVFYTIGIIASAYIFWLLISVIYLGDSTACPQNLC